VKCFSNAVKMINVKKYSAAKRHLTSMKELISLTELLNGKSFDPSYLILATNAARSLPRVRLLRNI
jgi:hypothetical protein